MAGINRLGKGPAKPGTYRPPDPNRHRTIDMFTEGAEGDIEYQRMVNDIEEMQQRQGWLTGRGAFDKADLLYLRDQAELERHKELELRDNERAQFLAMRAQSEAQIDSGPLITSALPPPLRPPPAPSETKPGAAALPIKPVVKPKPPSKQQHQQQEEGKQQLDEPAAKKQRLDDGSAAAPSKAAATELVSLLGDYGSGSDEDDAGDDDDEQTVAPVGSNEQQAGGKKAPVLPSAAELLGLGDGRAAAPAAPEASTQPAKQQPLDIADASDEDSDEDEQ